MSLRARVLTLVALVFPCASPVIASRVVVPDDFPSVQSAVTSGADTVVVKDGLNPERVVAPADVVLEPFAYPYPPGHQAFPSLRSLEITPLGGYSAGGTIRVRGFRLLGHLKFSTYNFTLAFENCRFDSAVVMPSYPFGPQSFALIGCLFLDTLSVRAGWVQMIGNTSIGSGVFVFADGDHDIRGNVVTGAPGPGLTLSLWDSIGEVNSNTVTDCGTGILVLSPPGPMRDNRIERCTGDGIVFNDLDGGVPAARLFRNVIRDCGGRGIVLGRGWTGSPIHANDIQRTGGHGMEFHDNSRVVLADSNRIVDAGGDGIRGANAEMLLGNIVIRAAGAGIRLRLPVYNKTVTNSTHHVVEANI
ncbi:MAG: right-handed parallel beta-helix repeat-containing protein [Candidatus Eisenbacteria bacterium]